MTFDFLSLDWVGLDAFFSLILSYVRQSQDWAGLDAFVSLILSCVCVSVYLGGGWVLIPLPAWFSQIEAQRLTMCPQAMAQSFYTEHLWSLAIAKALQKRYRWTYRWTYLLINRDASMHLYYKVCHEEVTPYVNLTWRDRINALVLKVCLSVCRRPGIFWSAGETKMKNFSGLA